MAQLAERLLPTTEGNSSYLAIGKIVFRTYQCFLLLVEKMKMTLEIAHQKRNLSTFTVFCQLVHYLGQTLVDKELATKFCSISPR